MARTKGSQSKKGEEAKVKEKKEEDMPEKQKQKEKEETKEEEEEPAEEEADKKPEAKAKKHGDKDEKQEEEKEKAESDDEPNGEEDQKPKAKKEDDDEPESSEDNSKKKKAEEDEDEGEAKGEPQKRKVAQKEPKKKELPTKDGENKKDKKSKKKEKKDKDKKKSKESKKEKKKKKKKSSAPAPTPDPQPEEQKQSKIGEYELRFGSLEVVLALGDPDATDPREKFLVGRLQEDVLFGCDKEAYVSVEWFDLLKDQLFEAQGLENIDYLPAGSLVCSVTRWCKEGFSKGKDTLTTTPEAWKYGERKLKEQLDDNYQSDEDSQFGDEVVNKRLKFIHKNKVDSGVKGRKPMKIKSEDEDDDDDDDDEASDEDAAPKTPTRKRKAGKKKAPTSPKSAKKPKRGLTPRPDLGVVEDAFDHRTGKLDNFDGDVERATKEVFRAVQADDTKALQAAVKSDKVLFSMHYPRSVGLAMTPLMFAMVDGNVEATKILLDDAKADSGNEKRAQLQKCALPKLSTGRISGRHADYNRRKINASRGGREGNNALLHDSGGDNYIMPDVDYNGKLALPGDMIPFFLHKYKDEMIEMSLGRDFDEIPKEILDLAEATYSRTLRNHMVIENIMRGGQRNSAKRFIEQQINLPYSTTSYNFLHLEALGDTPANKKKPFSKDFQAKSVAKLSQTETRFSPLACACINPKSAYLEALLTVAPEHAQLNDSKDTSLVHYAAACEGTEPLQYLLRTHSLSKTSIDKRKETPMHYAARAARPQNIEVLLDGTDNEQKKLMLNAKTLEGFAAIHYAVITQRCDGLETLRALLEAGSDPNLQSTAARNKVSPMHLAARVGNLEALKLLVKRGGNPAKVDKIGRSPLIHACMNGHAHIVSYLLVQGVSVETADSSDNFPVHYAAAYGWDDCLELLLKADANPDVKNSWKTSPLSVAVQKGRHRVSSLLFKIQKVDVNFKDDEGKTLFFRLVEGFIAEKMVGEGGKAAFVLKEEKDKKSKTNGGARDDEEVAALRGEMPWSLQKLLDRKDVDVATTDADGSNILHLLCFQEYNRTGYGEKRAVALAKLILSRGKFDLDSTDSSGMTPLLFAAKEDNSLLLEYLIDQGASMGPSFVDEEGKNLCHFLILSNGCQEQLKLVEEKAGESVLCEMLKAQDGLGFNPVHKAVQSLVGMAKGEKADSLQDTIKALVDRYPELATVTVGPISLLRDPDRLAQLILGEPEQEENRNNNPWDNHFGYHDDDDDDDDDDEEDSDEELLRYHGRRKRQPTTGGILSEQDRADAAKVRKALDSRDQAVPTTSADFGKSLIHFICGCKAPKRTKELLEWIVPLSKGVVDAEAGIDDNVYTPMQQLLYKVLPASDLRNQDWSGVGFRDRLTCLNLVVDSVEMLLENGAKDVNRRRRGVFKSLADMKRYRDSGEAELTKDKDAENVKTLKRHANAIVNKKENLEAARKDIVELFEKAMQDRKLRILSRSQNSKTLPGPLPHHLATSSPPIPISIWSKLSKKCGLDLMQGDMDGRSILHVALNKENSELSRFLCKECPELVSKASNTGELPIHVVAKLDKAPFVKLVLENLKDKGEEVNRGDKSGRTAFHFSVEKAAERHGEVLDPCEILFLRAGARLDIPDGMNKRTPLHYCFLEKASTRDHYNFPHDLEQGTHDRVELASSLLAAEGASESVKMTDKFGRTPLCYAAAYNSTVSSLLLVSKGANLFLEDQDGNTPINVSVLRGYDNYAITMLKSVSGDLPKLVDVVDVRRQEITADSGEKLIKTTSKEVHSIVWHAIRQNLRGLVYILLDTSFPLHQAAIDALSHGSFQLVRKLLTTSPKEVIRHVDPDSGRNLLHEVARVKQYPNSEWSTTLAEILLSSEVSAAAVTKDGQTALHIAASNAHLELVRLLVKTDEGALKISDSEGHVPLARFMRTLPQTSMQENRCMEMISLLTTGIESLSEDKYNRVPRTKREENKIEYDGIDFRLGPNKETVMQEIEARRSASSDKEEEESMDAIEGYSTLLTQALRAGKYQVMQQLVNKGAPVNSADSKGLAALHHAVASNSILGTKLLLRNKADPDIGSEDDRCITPLMVASFKSGADSSILYVAKLLIRFGADVTKTCKTTGATALHIACRENNLEFARLVLRGALHAAAKENTGKAKEKETPDKSKTLLVRFGQDCALYPAKIEGDTVKPLTRYETSVPLSCVSETFDGNKLCLDSMEALVKLKLANSDGKATVKTEASTRRRKRSGRNVFGGDDDSDEEMDEYEDGDEPSTQLDSSGRQAMEELRNYYGMESALVGHKDPQLTEPLEDGDRVIVQSREPKEYATAKEVWYEGKVSAVYKNGTYDVDVYRGLPIKGAVRQLLRPWKSGSEITWPSKAEKSNKSLETLLETKDKKDYTPLMAAIKPVEFGSYERSDMIDLLVEHGVEVDPASLELARPASAFLKHLQKIAGIDSMDTSDANGDTTMKEANVLHGLEPIPKEEFEEETKKALVKLEARGLMKRKDEPPRINPVCELKAVGLRVLPMETTKGADPSHYYDVVMTKVELSHYGHSENKYYKMQIVEDPNKNLFVLLNNWGQVGDYGGQKQETPFGSRDEAVTEFSKIFKAKSGNLWTDHVEQKFEPKLGKYKPARIVANGYEKPKLPNLVEMINDADEHPEIVRESKLPSDLTETMKAFVDPEAINAAANNLGLQQQKLPLGRMSIKTLLEAESKLDEVEKALQAVERLKKPEELKEKREAMDRVAILSSEFYELLPTKEGDNALSPLEEHELKEQRGHILNLKNLTAASQIVNTAYIKGTETNPLDYAYCSLGASLGVLSKETSERIGIEQYFRNTSMNDDLVISQVYSLNRHEEVSNKDMLNHRLLWHGTNRANVMGIIKEGLRIAPPTAMQSGNAFGDGVYFADMVSKSWNYCRENFNSNAKAMPKGYLFLADVALGEQECVREHDWFQKKIDESVDSVWAVGYEGPDVDKDVVLATSGAVMPIGKVMRSKTYKPKVQWHKGWHAVDDKISEAIEAVRLSPDTEYPVRVKTEFESHPAEVVLSRGPFSENATVVPVKVDEASDKASESNKKRKDNEGNPVKTENEDDDDEDEEEDEGRSKKRKTKIERRRQKRYLEDEHMDDEHDLAKLKKRNLDDGFMVDDDSSFDSTDIKGPADIEEGHTFHTFTINRKEMGIGSHVHYNEFIVNDTKRINLRFLVEVTSKSWLENKARKNVKNS